MTDKLPTVKIGENEYTPPFDSDKMNEYEEVIFDEYGEIVSIKDAKAALNELADLRAEVERLREFRARILALDDGDSIYCEILAERERGIEETWIQRNKGGEG